MTDSEMRRRLAEAMGWMELRAGAVRTLSGVFPEQNILVRTEVPDPLERDQDAALLRAWCAAQGWIVETRHTRGPSMASIAWTPGGDEHFCIVADAEEPDPCRRERLALCRAVINTLEALDRE